MSNADWATVYNLEVHRAHNGADLGPVEDDDFLEQILSQEPTSDGMRGGVGFGWKGRARLARVIE